ncbi:DEAD/DEAH box helicase [Paenibacillus solisilvae]|uniref:DEAD/DEAH box helicase n=1 Tax=Paenibacillus solisilvae TaxID=2486751 RepID=A0ABW0W7V5_9BACL
MKVILYVRLGLGETQARWSIAPEVDYAYWLDDRFRLELEEEVRRLELEERHRDERGSLAVHISEGESCRGLGRGERSRVKKNSGAGEGESDNNEEPAGAFAVAAWSEPLPLGVARGIAEKWPAAARPVHVDEACSILTRLVSDAVNAEAEQGFMAKPAPTAHAAHVQGPSAGFAADGGRARALALAAQAVRAAALLQGRALLSSEALALLGAAGAASPAGAAPAAWSAAARALQLAALLGQLRLGGAVAPQPQPGLLRWRQALGAVPRPPLLRCQRCGSGTARMRRTPCAACGRACAYCEACLNMGRSRECGLLIHGMPYALGVPVPPGASSAFDLTADRLAARLDPWKLSPAQSAAAAAALTFIETPPPAAMAAAALTYIEAPSAASLTCIETPPPAAMAARTRPWRRLFQARNNHARTSQRHNRHFLLWAVTGAGKTEMIFPLIESCILRGGRALLATPRRDVVLELDPRIRRAFPQTSVVTLYGGSEQRWEQGEITLATTHQLFRFRHGFDLVIIDELDAYPYHNDPMLHYAAEHAGKPGAAAIFLSATPPADMRRAVKRKRLAHVRVPVRFHRHPLPVPVQLVIPPVRQLLHKRMLPRRLVHKLQASINRGAQIFVFVQHIRDVEPLVHRFRRLFPGIIIEGTSSKDEERSGKVLRFRDRGIRMLVTTTILERGVTIAKSDVFILDADGKLFDDASLVQMAGRAGRSMDDPAGAVYFCASARNRSQQSAIKQIRGMNRIAAREGYLLQHKEGYLT